MTKAATFVLILMVSVSICLMAQSSGEPCPTFFATTTPISTPSKDLICVVPQIYGPSGLVGDNEFGPLVNTAAGTTSPHDVDFRNSTFVTLPALTSEIGTQLSQLPLASPVSGFIFAFSPSLGVMTEVTQNFGPLLSERGQTIARHRLFVGVSYQYFDFDQIDGVNLRNFGAVFRHEQTGLSACTSGPPTCADNLPVFAKDIVTTQNSLDLKIHEIAAVATFGFTDRLDVSVAVPILNVREAMYSTATIRSFETYPAGIDGNSCFDNPLQPALGVRGCMHQFSQTPVHGETLLPQSPYPFLQNQARFSKTGSASGVGDVLFRGKFQAIKGEKIGLAGGVDVHTPTGDELNLLGSGTWGTRPFVAVSHSGRIAPHASFGYQINGNSVLAGDITKNTKAHLPNVVTYDAGADFGVTRRIGVSADFIALALLNETKITQGTFTDFGGGTHSDIAQSKKETSNQGSVAIGGKVKPFGRLLITANVLIRLNDAGLHAKPVPLGGLSYTF
jgi:hypothetical protein